LAFDRKRHICQRGCNSVETRLNTRPPGCGVIVNAKYLNSFLINADYPEDRLSGGAIRMACNAARRSIGINQLSLQLYSSILDIAFRPNSFDHPESPFFDFMCSHS